MYTIQYIDPKDLYIVTFICMHRYMYMYGYIIDYFLTPSSLYHAENRTSKSNVTWNNLGCMLFILNI